MRFTSVVHGVLGALLLSACMRWQGAPVPAPRASGEPLVLGTARVTTWSGPDGPVGLRKRIVLRDVQVRGDSLIGWGGETVGSRERIAVHRDQVAGLEFGRRDWGRTAGAVVLSVVVVYGALVLFLIEPYGV